MLIGLLFAIEEAVDGPARLVATLPFAGATVIEHQARQLIAAGAAQIIVFGERQTPELLGALHRISRRGVAVDAVRSAVEAAATLHPLARLVMLADGLVTTDAVVRLLAREGGDALLAVPDDGAPAGFERIGGASAFAGAARLDPQRLGDLAQLPADYHPQSTLIRLAEAAGAKRLTLPAAALRDGHGIERDAASLDVRGRRIVASAVPDRHGWFDRWIAGPLLRLALPSLVARRVDTVIVVVAALLLALAGAAALVLDRPRIGLLLTLVTVIAAGLGSALAGLRDERGLRRGLRWAVSTISAVAVLLLGWRCGVTLAEGAALPTALALVGAAALVERTGTAPARGWGGPAGALAVVTAGTLLGWPLAGLVMATLYAVMALAVAIEGLRRDA